MRGLVRHEAALRAYVDGVESFGTIESAVRSELRTYAARRAARWSRCPAFVDDIEQVMLMALWRELDAFDATSDELVSAWCGARMEYAVRGFLRTHRRATDRHVYDDTIADTIRADDEYEAVELLVALRHVNDDGVAAYALAALDAVGSAPSTDVVSRFAMDGELLARLGWSDAQECSYAARRRAQRNVILREAIGGA